MSAPVPTRVLIVDDDDMVRRALRDYLSIAPDIDIVQACSDGTQALSVVTQGGVDIVLMDLHMPGIDGVQATEAIRRAAPSVKVIVLTSYDDDDAVARALAAGASGFLLKNIPPEALVDVIRGVRRGVFVMSDGPASRLRDAPRRPPSQAMSQLTDREREVLVELCRGYSNAEIGQRLFMSESSVKGYVTTVMRKLGATTRLKAVVIAHEMGFDAG